MIARRWWFARARIVHFVVIGGALYALASRSGDRSSVELDPALLDTLRVAQARKLGVPSLSEDGRREVDGRAIEDEILYREALRIGLDKGDPLVRQRLVQKLLLLVEDLGGASRQPTEAELVAYHAASRERWRTPARYRFVHVFAAERESLPAAEVIADAEEAPAAGEPFPYPRLATSSREEIVRTFGAPFAEAVSALRPGEVSLPVRSQYGWHRVRLLAQVDGALAPFSEVRQDVLLDYLLERRERVVGEYLKETVARYDVRVGGTPLRGFIPTRRVAARSEESAED